MNMKKRVLIFLMALAMLATLAACGGGGKSPAGTYKLTQINSGGEEMSVKDLADLFGMEIDMTLELKDDKSFTWDMGLWGEGESASGTWKMDGDSLVLSAEGEDLPVTYDGKTMLSAAHRPFSGAAVQSSADNGGSRAAGAHGRDTPAAHGGGWLRGGSVRVRWAAPVLYAGDL